MSPWRTLLCLSIAILGYLPAAAAPWISYERSTLAKDQYLDGDSFQAVTTTGGKRPYTYIFRLYGADCAETDASYPERLAAQATDFRIPVGEVIGWGEKATAFTEKFLAKPFSVHTQKVSARGTSKKNRYYAIVIGADGRDLAEALIRAGLARAFGVLPLDTPDGGDGKAYNRKLQRAEAQARTDKVGIWGGNTPKPAATPDFFKSKLPMEKTSATSTTPAE